MDSGSKDMKWIESYIQEIKQKNKNKKVIIYGAGKIGRLILSICESNCIKVESFCVTTLEENQKTIRNVPVWQFDQLKYRPDEMLILIGIKERGKHRIKESLEQARCFNYMETPENILDFDEWEFKRKRRPALEITPKVGCYVNCKYCPQQLFINKYFKDNKERKTELSLEEYKHILDKLPQNTLIEWAGFVEPFLNSSVADMMLYTQKMGFEQTLFTTLVGMKDEDFEKIKKIPFKLVCLHTPDAYGYANIPITPQYIKMFEKVINTKNVMGESFVTTANCQSKPHPDILQITAGKLKIYVEISDRAGTIDDDENKNIVHFSKVGRIWCERAEFLNHNILLPDGTVVLCCNDFGLQYVLGNLLLNNYEDLMTCKTMRMIKYSLIHDNIPVICRKCAFAKEID